MLLSICCFLSENKGKSFLGPVETTESFPLLLRTLDWLLLSEISKSHASRGHSQACLPFTERNKNTFGLKLAARLRNKQAPVP